MDDYGKKTLVKLERIAAPPLICANYLFSIDFLAHKNDFVCCGKLSRTDHQKLLMRPHPSYVFDGVLTLCKATGQAKIKKRGTVEAAREFYHAPCHRTASAGRLLHA
jgi:hypothetical protein